ncbi:MAG: hypothetical protein AAFV54_04675 [Pseudomonadota bacterium]
MTTRDDHKDKAAQDLREEFASLTTTGKWMAWAGFGCALLWWGAASGILIGLFGMEQLTQQSMGVLSAVAALIFLPGMMMTLAGLMARQSKQATDANTLVLKAAETLLAPAKTAERDITRLAEATRTYAESVNRTATDTLTALKAASDKLENERLRVESVSYAMADNSRELTQRLKEERHAIESIAKNIDLQTRGMTDAIPRQAASIAAAAKQAGEDVAEADLALEKQLHKLKNAGSTLAVRLSDLEAVAKDASSRTDTLNQSLARIEAKLGESEKTIKMAEQASSMAVDAASGAGNALRDAVSAALDSARDANAEIVQTTQKVQEDAARTLVELRQASLDASSAASKTGDVLRAAMPAADKPSDSDDGQPKTNGADQQPIALNGKASNGSAVLRGRASENNIDRDRSQPEGPLRAPTANSLPPPSAPTAGDDDLFDSDDAPAPKINVATPDDPEPAPKIGELSANGQDRTEWREIIADLEEGEASEASTNGSSAPLAREETADQLISRLESSGIPLPKAFKPRDKKRIAAAARRDEKARRSAIRQAAGAEVDRVAVRLKKDTDLMRLAQHFVMAEEPEALLALDKTSGSRRPASPRLSAYLLVDAALEALGS